jgi:OHCU decarboxylase
MTLDDLNHLDAASAERELLRCCGSTRWAREMTAARPFDDANAMIRTSEQIWSSLDRADWLEAFAAHPRIGAENARSGSSTFSALAPGPHARRELSLTPRGGPRGVAAGAADWSAEEQAGLANTSNDVRERLTARNRDYEARFGYIFIVCATGKSADEMLSMLERRLTNEECRELGMAAEEQRKITNLRIAKLLT